MQLNFKESDFVMHIINKQDALRSVNSLGLYNYAHYCTMYMIHTVHSSFN